jgi:hypothetical protein
MSKRKRTYDYDSLVIFWNCFESTDFNSILLFVVFIALSSVVVLTQIGQFSGCAAITLSER